jgi:uncharacterized OB-fold protein
MTDTDFTYRGMDLSALAAEWVDGRRYFEEASAGRFVLPVCSSCGSLRFPPVGVCPSCTSTEFRWEELDGQGSVYSYSVIRHAIHPGYLGLVPIVNVVVELDPQPAVPTAKQQTVRIPGQLFRRDLTPEDPGAVGIGSRVSVVFDPINESLAYPQWMLTEGAGGDVWRLPTS